MSFHENSFHKPATPKVKRSQSPDSNQKTLTRPGSASLINKCLYRLIGEVPKCHGKLLRKAENLEKNQEKWKIKAQAWDREKRGYIQAIENYSKNSADYYKEQLNNWNSNRLLRSAIILEDVIDWIQAQDESVLEKIKDTIIQKSPKIIENSLLSNSNMENCLKDLMEKNEQLSSSLFQIENELKSKVEGVESLKEKIINLKAQLLEKDSSLTEEKALNETLMARLNRISPISISESDINQEVESKDLEIVVLKAQNTQLQCSILEYQRTNQVYLETIQDLKQKICLKGEMNESFTDLSSLEELESFSAQDLCDAAVQTESKAGKTSLMYLKCMASAVEDLMKVQKKGFK